MSLPTPSVSGYSSFWGNPANSYQLLVNKAGVMAGASRVLARQGMRELRALMLALNGASAGGTASRTVSRVLHSTNGGAKSIETVTVINRATTANDKSFVDDVLNRFTNAAPSSYPVDASGVGGGGKLGGF